MYMYLYWISRYIRVLLKGRRAHTSPNNTENQNRKDITECHDLVIRSQFNDKSYKITYSSFKHDLGL